MKKPLTRAAVAPELTWSLTDIFPTPKEWEEELTLLMNILDEPFAYKGRLGEGADVLLSCLQSQEEIHARFLRVAAYASLGLSVDGTDSAHQIAAGRALAVGARWQALLSLVRSEIQSLPQEEITSYLREETELRSFEPMLDRIMEEKQHMLEPDTERILASLNEVLNAPSLVYQRAKTTDMKFAPAKDQDDREHPVTFSTYEGRFELHPDPVLRRNAYASFSQGLAAYQHTLGATWATEVKKNVVMARLRGYPSAIHMLLDEQQISPPVYHNLHDVILRELAPHMRRYARLRKRVLGLEEMLYCDIEAPLDPQFQPEVSFEEAGTMLREGLSVLGDEYVAIVDAALSNRWIDRADNVGKSTGAFCHSVYGVHPYILMTWNNSMRNVLTLAHELGHAGHGVLAQRHQRLANCRTSMFFIEAPSTINEILVGKHILSNQHDSGMRRWLLMQRIMTYHHNFVRHLIEGELQRRLYAFAEKGVPITTAHLNSAQGDILDEFWGGEVTIDQGARLTWMRQPHYYRGLYPYTYSAGLTIGTAVARALQEDGEAARERWLQVLCAGGTRKPLELAQMAGVDMTRTESIKEAVDYVGQMVDEVITLF